MEDFDETYRCLRDWLKYYEGHLKPDQDMAVTFGGVGPFRLSYIVHEKGKSLILLLGNTDNGTPIHLIQHLSQINVLTMVLPRTNPDQPRKAIGFGTEMEPEAKA